MSDIILAIDSSINYCSVAIHKKKHIYSLSDQCKKQHTIKILPMVQKILFKTQTKFEELNYIAFSKGPGNFTGIRIAGSIAASFSISLNIPIIGTSTLAIMAEQAWRKYKKNKIIVSIDARKKEAYWAKYIRNEKSIWIGENTESLLDKKEIKENIEKLKKWTFVSNGWEQIEWKNFSCKNNIKNFSPNAKDIIPFVLSKIKNKEILGFSKNSINYLDDNF